MPLGSGFIEIVKGLGANKFRAKRFDRKFLFANLSLGIGGLAAGLGAGLGWAGLAVLCFGSSLHQSRAQSSPTPIPKTCWGCA